ncbi:signal recognition particle receptor beta subunit-domain-containing protein [Cyathus striatus]|nr:signal recognition particle receptor beta subunit-domain-containing protein [Cyathus striatus]
MDADNGRPHRTPEVLSIVPEFSPQTILLASLSLAILLLAVAIFFGRKRATSKGNALLLVGPSDAGKTALLSQLVYKQTLPTYTSLQTNSSLLSLDDGKKVVKIVDVPGHPRIRDQFREYLADAKVIAFVVDASTVSRNGAAVAEHLHQILHAIMSLPPSHTLPTLVIFAHKIDLLKSSSSSDAGTLAINRVKTILERELEKRRQSQSGVGVEGLGAEDEKTEIGGLECGDNSAGFKFDEWEGGDVTFIATTAKSTPESVSEKQDEDGLSGSELEEWLAANM